MRTAVAVRFPLGRYHATPWDASVNEGRVEWPPSPWRILRALVSTWKTRLPDLGEDQVMALLNALVTDPPAYWSPQTALGHTRHYMPSAGHVMNKPGKNRDLAFDAFLAINPTQELIVEFAPQIKSSQQELLSTLVGALHYLGRADSVCHARVVNSPAEKANGLTLYEPDWGGDTRLLAPTPPFTLRDLSESPTALRQSKRLDPPKTRWVQYKRVAHEWSPRAPAPTRSRSPVTAVRWYLPDSGRPSIVETVALGHLLRRAVMRQTRDPSYALSGRTDSGPRSDQHQHAHYLAFSSQGDGRVDTLAIWAPGGLSQRDIAGVARLRRLSAPEYLRRLGTYRLGLEVLSSTRLALPELVGPSREWTSLTPYIPGRSWGDWTTAGKRIPHVTDDLNRELGYRGLPQLVHIEEVNKPEWRRFRRARPHHSGRRPPAISLRLVFERAVPGPLALGYLSHFGLGLFRPSG